jgi:prepilin-type N-terminal cleavage/methylation domain-containing protein
MKRRPQGFTLIEIAIVLMIAAILLGGIALAGNAMIERAHVTSLLGRIKDLAAASRDFKARYGYLPGDLPNAQNYISTVTSACNYVAGSGVGDGKVDPAATEGSCVLEHLVKAGLLTGVQVDTSSKYFLSSNFGAGVVTLGYVPTTNENAVVVTALPCSIALELAGRLDNDSATPLNNTRVKGLDSSNAVIGTCTLHGTNDPVAAFLVRY